MKKIFDFLFGGKKKNEKEHGNKHNRIDCDFGIKKFNQRKRPIEEAPGGVKGKKPKPTQPPPDQPPPPPPPSGSNVIYLDFWGATISGTMWNANGTFTVGDAGLSQVEHDYILAHVKKQYEGKNVIVTTDESVFNAAPIGRKIRVLITESWEWFGQAGGVAYLNSFFWTDGSPAFVFSLLLNYSVHNIAEACSHEAGHTIGLRHKSTYDANCVMISEYDWSGFIMGASYNVEYGFWGIGPTPLGCTNIQDDNAVLNSKLV